MHTSPPRRSSATTRPRNGSSSVDETEALSAQLSQVAVSAPATPLLSGLDSLGTGAHIYSPAQTTPSLRGEGLQAIEGDRRPVYHITINASSVSLTFNGTGPVYAHRDSAPGHQTLQRHEVTAQEPAVASAPDHVPASPQPHVAAGNGSSLDPVREARMAARARAKALAMRHSERIPWDPEKEIRDPCDERHRGKWYVVARGLRVGIFRSWLEASRYVNNVSGAVHKSFKSYHDAEAYYEQSKAIGNVWLLRI